MKPCQNFRFRVSLREADDVVEVWISRGIGEMSVGCEDAATSAVGRS
jgi:hypothetical protein